MARYFHEISEPYRSRVKNFEGVAGSDWLAGGRCPLIGGSWSDVSMTSAHTLEIFDAYPIRIKNFDSVCWRHNFPPIRGQLLPANQSEPANTLEIFHPWPTRFRNFVEISWVLPQSTPFCLGQNQREGRQIFPNKSLHHFWLALKKVASYRGSCKKNKTKKTNKC